MSALKRSGVLNFVSLVLVCARCNTCQLPMRDEQGGKALAAPRSNVQTLRELFNDKDVRCMPHVASVKKREGPTEVRIPRPSLAPKPPSNRKLSVGFAKEASTENPSPAGQSSVPESLHWAGGASFEHSRVQQVEPSGTAEVSSIPCEDLSVVGGKSPDSGSLFGEALSEEDYVTPISLSPKPPDTPQKRIVATSPLRSEEVLPCLPKLAASLAHKAKPKLPEPPLYVPPQLVHHPVVPGWQRRELPVANTTCPPKPARPFGMRLLVHSSLQDGPSLPNRSTPPVPPSRAPPPRPSVPKPPRLLPSLPTASADDACLEPRQPTSPIPEYTEDEELGRTAAEEELYADTEMDEAPPSLPPARTPSVPPRQPDDELYQDTLEELYEEMPTEEIAPALPPPMKVLDSLPRKHKQDVGKAFGLASGWEKLQPLDAGHARTSSTGGTKDLPLRCGEPVYILRFENNPPGKWLVRNHQGEVGYADLMNIEVDAESVKFIMTSHRSPSANLRKQPSSAMQSGDEEEAIYEETF